MNEIGQMSRKRAVKVERGDVVVAFCIDEGAQNQIHVLLSLILPS